MIISRRRIKSGSENPQIEEEFGTAQQIEFATPKGFLSIPDIDDEVIVIDAFGDPRHKTAIGVIEAGKFGVQPGDRLIITDNAAILLKKNGTIRLDAVSNIQINAPRVDVTSDDINMIGNFEITGTGKLNGSDIATV